MGRRTIAIIIAVILALAAAGLVFWYVSSVKKETSKDEEAQAVLVAREDIPAKTTGEAVVSKGLVERKQMPKRYVAPGALTDESQLQGKVVTVQVAKGQQVVAAQLGTPATESLAFRVQKGMRAVSVPVDRIRGVGGNITPGDRVDVIVTFEYDTLNQANVNLGGVLSPAELERVRVSTGVDPKSSKASITRTVLQQVEVLEIDPLEKSGATGLQNRGAEGGPDQPVVVLMLSLADAERLVFAQEQGKVWFVLVPSEDKEPVATPGRAIANVFAK